MRENPGLRLFGVSVASAACLSSGACGPSAGALAGPDSGQGSSPAVRGLRLRAQLTNHAYDAPESFALEVVFENVGDLPVAILPAMVRRRYRPLGSGSATYVPYPGPPIFPWRDAFVLGPGVARTVTITGMRDGDGIWALAPGAYELSVRYVVEEALAWPAVPADVRRSLGAAGVWMGALETPGIEVTFRSRASS